MHAGDATRRSCALGLLILTALGCSDRGDAGTSEVEAKRVELTGEAPDAGLAAAADGGTEPSAEDAGVIASPPDPTEPSGFWRFDDCKADESELMDSSGQWYDHPAARSESVGCVLGQLGKAVSFDDEAALVQVATSPTYNADAGITLAAWIQPNAVFRTQAVVRRHGAFALMIHHGRYYFVARLDSGRLASVSAPARAGVWTHVTASYDGKQLKMFLNGGLANRVPLRGKLAQVNTPLLMGNDNAGHRFVGLLDSVWFNTLAAADETILGLTCLPAAPEIHVTPEQQPAVRAGTVVSYSIEVENKNAAYCPAWRYSFNLFSNATNLDSLPNFYGPAPITSGEKVTYDFDVTSSAESEPGRYEVQVWVLDDFGDVWTGVPRATIVRPTYTVAEPPACYVAPGRELLIRDVSVVDDPLRAGPGGAWSFGHLMRELALTEQAAPAFVEAFFRSFQVAQQVNGFELPALPLLEARVLRNWPRTAAGALDLARAPLRLLAIANRLDLADLTQHKAGEVHLVYGVLDAEGHPLGFTLNFEYALPAQTESDVRTWSEAWRALHDLPFPSEDYNQALEAITERIIRRGAAHGGSTLIDIQTNETSLAEDDYNRFRAYRLSADASALEPVPLTATPDVSLNLTPTLARYITTNQRTILNGSALLPADFEGAPFQAGEASTVVDMWEAPDIDLDARYAFSLATCNGCHFNETHARFHHVVPREAGTQSAISRFLSGQVIADYISEKQLRQHELTRRQMQLETLYCPAP